MKPDVSSPSETELRSGLLPSTFLSTAAEKARDRLFVSAIGGIVLHSWGIVPTFLPGIGDAVDQLDPMLIKTALLLAVAYFLLEYIFCVVVDACAIIVRSKEVDREQLLKLGTVDPQGRAELVKGTNLVRRSLSHRAYRFFLFSRWIAYVMVPAVVGSISAWLLW